MYKTASVTNPVQRTQAQRRAHTRRALLDSAREVFGRRGFEGATLDEISQAASLTRGALYYNFPGGKEDLFLALLDERIAERSAAIEDTFGDGQRGRDATVRQAEEAASDASAFLTSPENREWRMLFFEFVLRAARDRRFAAEFVKREQGMRDALAGVIEARAADLGGEPPMPAEQLATGINALANGLALDTLLDEQSVPEELFSTLIGFMVRGIVAGAQEALTGKAEADDHRGGDRG